MFFGLMATGGLGMSRRQLGSSLRAEFTFGLQLFLGA